MRDKLDLVAYNELAFVCSLLTKLQQEHAGLWTEKEKEQEEAFIWLVDFFNKGVYSGDILYSYLEEKGVTWKEVQEEEK